MDIDLTKAVKLPYSRVTEEQADEFTLKKTEQVIHQKYKSSYFAAVLVQKYKDNKLLSAYSWIQPLTQDELQEIIDHTNSQKPKKTPFDREQYYRDYYEKHKEEMKNKSKEYYEKVLKRKAYEEQYKQEHYLEIKERKHKSYLKRKALKSL